VNSLQRIRLRDFVKLIPPGPNGKPRHVSCLYRYSLRGIRGVRLRVEQLPCGLHTTWQWWTDFIEALTQGRRNPTEGFLPSGSSAVSNKDHRRIEAELVAVQRVIRRPVSSDAPPSTGSDVAAN
jgi:hypothetical protein